MLCNEYVCHKNWIDITYQHTAADTKWPWCILGIRGTLGCALVGTTLNASDRHNAQATIRNPLYSMEYKIIKKQVKNRRESKRTFHA